MSETKDTMEKVEQEMRAEADAAHNDTPARDVGWHILRMYADRLRALRERQEKAWEKVDVLASELAGGANTDEGRPAQYRHFDHTCRSGGYPCNRCELVHALRAARLEAQGE